MLNKILSIAILVMLLSCNDGDVFVAELDFGDDLESCAGVSDVIIYKLKTSPDESLSIKMPVTVADHFETVGEVTENLSATNTFNYRAYTGNPTNLFCNSLLPSSPLITNNSEATSGIVKFVTTLIEDDNDGIPAHLEGQDPNGDGDFSDAQDTDGDGEPDYLDSDDDGDNVPTSSEVPDDNGDGDLSDARDTDGDGIPDYLDDDDDGDGTITRYEDTDLDKNPANDFNGSLSILADYLNPAVMTSSVIDEYADHTINQVFYCVITLQDVLLINANTGTTIISENFAFGVLETTINDVNNTVDFN